MDLDDVKTIEILGMQISSIQIGEDIVWEPKE